MIPEIFRHHGADILDWDRLNAEVQQAWWDLQRELDESTKPDSDTRP